MDRQRQPWQETRAVHDCARQPGNRPPASRLSGIIHFGQVGKPHKLRPVPPCPAATGFSGPPRQRSSRATVPNRRRLRGLFCVRLDRHAVWPLPPADKGIARPYRKTRILAAQSLPSCARPCARLWVEPPSPYLRLMRIGRRADRPSGGSGVFAALEPAKTSTALRKRRKASGEGTQTTGAGAQTTVPRRRAGAEPGAIARCSF